jgi:UDP-GlcNAc:undecaprenyl-phosphate GlcNAc-1-phosphate transferase
MTRAARAHGLAAAGVTGGLAAVTARAAYALLRRRAPGGPGAWARTNHRGEPVTLLEGPAVAVAAVAAAALGPGLPARSRAALAIAGTGAAAFGCYDDLAGSGARRGFRGHLGALAHGELTSGAVKIGGIGASGAVAAAVLSGSAADIAVNAGLAAGGANLLNLFDLRPGRAIKVTLAAAGLLAATPRAATPTAAGAPAATPTAAGPPAATPRAAWPARCAAAAPAGAAIALLPDDLGERAMLGDAGANALGAVLGTAAAATLPRTARVAVLAAIVGLTAASEVVSFTKVIERTPPLRWLDMLGRRPPAAAAQSGPAAAGQPQAGQPQAGQPQAGQPQAGQPQAGQQQAGPGAQPGDADSAPAAAAIP